MAQVTRDLSFSKFSYCKQASPNAHDGTNTSTQYRLSDDYTDHSYDNFLLFGGLAAFPSSLKRNKIISAALYAYIQGGTGYLLVKGRKDFDASTVTYNSLPAEISDISGDATASDLGINVGSWANLWVPIYYPGYSDRAAIAAAKLLQNKTLALSGPITLSGNTPWLGKTVLANGSTRPYIRVTYDDTAKVTSKPEITTPLRGSNPLEAMTAAWRLIKSDAASYCYDETWTQASAKLFWRVQGSGSAWNAISVSGSTMSVTVPGGTFPAGKTIEYYVQTTDTDGTTANSTTMTVIMDTPVLTVTYPIGTSRDSRADTTWTWTLKIGTTEYTQSSAKLYWRIAGASTWNTISIAGNTKTKTVPGYTFPAGQTIEWYMTSTDKDGNVITLSARTFGTSGTALALQTYPSGSGVDSRSAATFSWRVYNGYGDFTQASAKFCWRVSGASSWNEISIAGNTKTLSVPGYTFPAGSTIQWYLTATDKDGTVLTSSTQSLTTASVSLRMTANPSGSNLDPRNAATFSWSLYNAAGEYTQSSAKLYWRVGSTGAWHEISISGNTKTYSVPANTFPTGSTIQWYLSSVGKTDTTHTTNTASFTTAAPKITAVTYPSGNNVESGQPLTFSWAFRSGQAGQSDYTQASARLYWRASTSDPYQSIAASGSTTRLTVPKNTFPGNASTIYWYLEGTDAGGYTSQTSVSSFRTVTSQITPQGSPTSGYQDPRVPITFAWYFKTPTASYDQASAVFHWRVSGASSWTDVAASGSNSSVTIAANTFPVASTIEWYLSGTDAGGCSSESPVYSFSTAASTTYAICQDPIGIVEDGTKPITFRWIVQNTDGAAPTRTRLWWKLPTESSSQWHQLLDTTDAVYSYTAAANTFAAGPVEWRVQAYNRDSVAGPVSEASFVVLRAPEAPEGLSATSVPLSTVSWQSDGQEGYEITLDGEIVAAEYGPSVYSWTVPEPLADGVHVFRVRIQGSYGLWSDYAETSISVQNTPGGSLALSGSFGLDADLSVTPEDLPDSAPIQWYRDGKRIAKTSARQFRDRMVLGSHVYYAEIWQADGNYTRSNTVEGTMATISPMIAAADGGEWLALRLSENRERTQSFEWANTIAMQHIAAADYPILEQSRFEDMTATFDCAFIDPAEARRFEAMRKKTVIVKSRSGQVIIGGFSQFTKTATAFYVSYTFSIQQIHREDFTDDTVA